MAGAAELMMRDMSAPPPVRAPHPTAAPNKSADDDQPSFAEHVEAEVEALPEAERQPPRPRAEPDAEQTAAASDQPPSDTPPAPGLQQPQPEVRAQPFVLQIVADAAPTTETATPSPETPAPAPNLLGAPEAPLPAQAGAATPVAPSAETSAQATPAPAIDAAPTPDVNVAPVLAANTPAPIQTSTNATPKPESAATPAPVVIAAATAAPNAVAEAAAAPVVKTPATTNVAEAPDATETFAELTHVDAADRKARTPLVDGKAPEVKGEDSPKAGATPLVLNQGAAKDGPRAPVSAAAPDISVAPKVSVESAPPAQLTQTATSQAAHSTHAESTTRVTPAAAQVGREIVRRFNGGATTFEMRLDPAELGRVDVKLEVSRDHRVTAVISADNPAALTELARGARELEQALQAAGLELSEDGLRFDLSDHRNGFQDSEASNGGPRGGAAQNTEEPREAQASVARPVGFERWRGVRVDLVA